MPSLWLFSIIWSRLSLPGPSSEVSSSHSSCFTLCACPPSKLEASPPWRCALCTSVKFFPGTFPLPSHCQHGEMCSFCISSSACCWVSLVLWLNFQCWLFGDLSSLLPSPLLSISVVWEDFRSGKRQPSSSAFILLCPWTGQFCKEPGSFY